MRISEKAESFRVLSGPWRSKRGEQSRGQFLVDFESRVLTVLACDGSVGGWEHVSVSLRNRCPNWKEMCFIKSLFWEEEDAVIQIHPPKSQYVNNHPYCLHLWRNTKVQMELPPWTAVGVKLGEV